MRGRPSTRPPVAINGCQNCGVLMKDVMFWKRQTKIATTRRDELDRTILSMDGGIGHWRRLSKELSTLLNNSRAALNALRDPNNYRHPSQKKLDEDVLVVTRMLAAAAEREEDVERRITNARDALYRLRNQMGVDTPAGKEIYQVWSTL